MGRQRPGTARAFLSTDFWCLSDPFRSGPVVCDEAPWVPYRNASRVIKTGQQIAIGANGTQPPPLRRRPRSPPSFGLCPRQILCLAHPREDQDADHRAGLLNRSRSIRDPAARSCWRAISMCEKCSRGISVAVIAEQRLSPTSGNPEHAPGNRLHRLFAWTPLLVPPGIELTLRTERCNPRMRETTCKIILNCALLGHEVAGDQPQATQASPTRRSFAPGRRLDPVWDWRECGTKGQSNR
jgi:hypothetical protein